MRRTYKSKKETGGAFDPRDVLLTMDSKSSLFDAFYINNIKQTKRELSVVPSVQFATSNRVRKRKYVKRLKEQEPVVRESSSTSAFLTPDKSFRVNKAPDPFDQLLNSSNRSLIETKKFHSNKKQKSKTYCQIKSIRKKKINYSSGDSTDSDKENSDSSIENNTTQNNSDVLSHKLLIERDNEKSPKQDESIADIVKNLSLFKESKDKVSTSPRGVRNRITHLSEISNSPLCSTPFFDKYRGKSIYKFSPIPINLNDSPSSLILAEGNNDVENSIIEVKEKKYDSYNEIKHETINDVNVVSCEVQSPILPHKTSNDTPKTKTVTSDPLPEVTLQTSEVQPFLGFTNIEVSKTDNLDTIADKLNKLEKVDSIINVSVEVVNECVSNTNENSIENIEVIEKETQSNSSIHGSHTNSSLESDDNESFYGTCNSEDFEDDNQPIVVIERLNDSVFKKYYDKMADYSNVSNNTHSDDVFSDEYASVDDRSSISDSSEHDNTSSESIIGDEVCGENTSQVSIDDHLQNHSFDSGSNSDVNKTEEHDNISSESIIGHEVCGENTSQVSIDDHLQNHSLDSSSNSDVNKTEEHGNISSESIIGDKVCGENTSQVSIDDHLQNHSFDSGSNSDVNKTEEHDNISSESIIGDEVCGENTSQVSIDDHLQNHSLDSSSNSDVNKTEEHDNISSESIIGDKFCGENTSQVSIDDHLQNHSLDSGSNSDVNKTEEHDNISSESIIGVDVCGKKTSQVSIDDHLQNHSLDSSSNSDVNKTEEHDNISRESIISDEVCEENTSQITKDDHLQNHSLDSDCNSDGNESENEVYISFVTTRRRNDIINDSLILGLDNSITSGSSAEVDKTVLKRDSLIEDIEGNGDKTLIKDKSGDYNTDAKNNSNNNIVQEGHNIETVSKSSPNDFNKSISKEKSINRTSFKLRKGSKSPNAINISTNIEIDSNLANKVMTRKSVRLLKESIGLRSSLKPETSASSLRPSAHGSNMACDLKQGIVLQPGKRWERSLSIYRRMTTMSDYFDSSILDDEPLNKKGRKYRQSVISTMEMQDFKGSLYNDSINSRRSTFVSKPSRSTIRIVRDLDTSRSSLCSTSVLEESQGFLTEDCDDTIVELSKLSIADSEHEVTVLEKFHDTSSRFPTARDYVLRRCNQTDIVLFDECYPDTVLKNCRKIGEGVYGEVFLWRAGDGKARVLKIIPIAGNIKVNGENQKDYNEIISEIVIAMELSALRTPIDEIEKHFNEGKSVETLDLHSVENATDVFNEVLAVRCVYGTYPSRLLDLWDLYDECKGSENDNPAILPIDQQYIVLELANAGQDLESYQFNNAEQAYALFKQVAFGLAVAEEAYQFEHRDLHWGNVLISPTDQKHATFVIRGRVYRVARRGVAASLIDYSLSRASLRLPSGTAELYNDLSTDDSLFDAVGDYQFEVYRLMRDKLGNDWKNFEPYTNILWLHYTVDKMITSLRYSRTNTKIHKHYIAKLKEIKNRVLDYGSAVQYVLTDNDL